MQLVLRGRWRKVGNFCLQLNLQSILQRNATNNGRNWKRSDSQASDTICDMPWILPTYFKIFNGKPKYKISQNVIVLYQIFILIFNVFQGLYQYYYVDQNMCLRPIWHWAGGGLVNGQDINLLVKIDTFHMHCFIKTK